MAAFPQIPVKTTLTLYYRIPHFSDPEKGVFENIIGKGQNISNGHFLLFPECFIPYQRQLLQF